MKFVLFLVFSLYSFSTFAQCDEVVINVDKFTDKRTISTPGIIKLDRGITAGKNILSVGRRVVCPAQLTINTTSDSTYSLMLAVPGQSTSFPSAGAYIIFANGEKMQYPQAKVLEQYMSGNYVYFAFIYPDEEELKLLKESPITDIRVDNFACSVSPWLGERMRAYMGCADSLK